MQMTTNNNRNQQVSVAALSAGSAVDSMVTWVDTETAAAHLGVPKRTLEAFRLTGGGPKYAKCGRKVRYRIDWINSWLEGRVVQNTAEAKQRGL